ncbi:MAG: hypothetical protein JRJ85_16680 [Deltaproteobacteria bacterium]|nr:hypothetical protein [Deltaproteobacteria bacterium]
MVDNGIEALNPDLLKPLASVHQPDPRTEAFIVMDETTGASRSISIADQHSVISGFRLNAKVPSDIVVQYETAKNIYLYAWFVYRFYPVAEHQALTCLEYALKKKFEKDMIAEGWDKHYRPTLRPLLSFARGKGHIKNEDFKAWHDAIKRRAIGRFHHEIIEKMKNKDIYEMIVDDSEVEFTEEDKDLDYIGPLLDHLPRIRNEYAHGSDMLYKGVSKSFQVVMEIINKIYPD